MESFCNSARLLVSRFRASPSAQKVLFRPASSLSVHAPGKSQMLPPPLQSITQFTPNPSVDWNQNVDFFTFTRGRFLHNDEQERAFRHVSFDMNELAQIAAKAAGSKTCVNIEKFPDGTFNKVFLMTMEGGKQVIAKVPNRSAGQAHFTTASEVATMEFVRTVIGTPVPKILAWNSRREATSVGAEYIIMEKVNGVPLADVWSSIEMKDQVSIIQTIGKYQAAWMQRSFNQFGSIYFKDDLEHPKGISYADEDGQELVDDRFAIGPSVSRQSNDDGRSDVTFDRGPWSSLEEYQLSIGKREATCIEQIDRLPKSPFTLPGPYVPTRAKKLAALAIYSQIVKYLLPKDPSIVTSNIWHSDLHEENILVNPNDPTEILAIIDWQSVELMPLFQNAGVPPFLQYDGMEGEGIELPKCPDTSAMDPATKEHTRALWTSETLVAYYRKMTKIRNPALYRAMQFQNTPTFDALLFPRNILVDGESVYLWKVANELKPVWSSVPGFRDDGSTPFPIEFSAEELKEIDRDLEMTNRGLEYMSTVEEHAELDLWAEKGMVSHDKYDDVKKALREAKEMALKRFATTEEEKKVLVEGWPFDD